jgi:CheY-like chemotaxis protein
MDHDPRRETKTVLCVDDSPVIRGLIAKGVTAAGFKVVACASGAQCLVQLDTLEPDVILLDLEMPGMSGLATLEAIRRRFPERQTRIVMLTTSRTREAVDGARHRGANDYILKSAELGLVIERIDFWAGLRTF